MSNEDEMNGCAETGNMSIDSDSEGDDWSENEDGEEPTKCLFCTEVHTTVEKAIEHVRTFHNVDLGKLKSKFHMDCYSYIKMINYIRKNNAEPKIFESMNEPVWNDEKYLKPVEYEPWLTYDFESLDEVTESQENPSSTAAIDFAKLRAYVQQLEKEIEEKNKLLEQAAEDITKMKTSFKNLIDKDSAEGAGKSNISEKENTVASISLKTDDNYFKSYSGYEIHYEMLSDEVRTKSYRDALLKNKDFIAGKSVLDLGCGTSILSMFAAQAGAEVVVAIDNSDVLYQAMDIARTNKFESIQFVKGRLEDTQLPIDKFDIVVSEWMGYFLIFEGMLDSVIYARDRHLKPGGTLIPNRCNISLVGYGDIDQHQRNIGFWKNVYGFDMSCMEKEVLQVALVAHVDPDCVLTEPNVIADYDLMNIDFNYSNFTYDFNLRVLKDGKLTGFVGYFDTFFDLPHKVFFSTSPSAKRTHWKQITFFLKDPVDVKASEDICGTIVCRRARGDLRALKIKIKVFGKEFSYDLD